MCHPAADHDPRALPDPGEYPETDGHQGGEVALLMPYSSACPVLTWFDEDPADPAPWAL